MWAADVDGSVSLPMTVPRVRRLLKAEGVSLGVVAEGDGVQSSDAPLVDKGALLASFFLARRRLGTSQVDQVLSWSHVSRAQL